MRGALALLPRDQKASLKTTLYLQRVSTTQARPSARFRKAVQMAFQVAQRADGTRLGMCWPRNLKSVQALVSTLVSKRIGSRLWCTSWRKS